MANVRFYKTKGTYGCFTNFSKHPIELKGEVWPTTEHYYQAQKFADREHESEIRLSPSAWHAAKRGRERCRPLRDDWEMIKEPVMYDAIKAKFTQHEDARQVLLSTGDDTLIEDSPIDWY